MPEPEDELYPRIEGLICEDRISALSDDLLIHILLRVPTKDAVATTFLSKRWRRVWTMLPRLNYKETKDSNEQSKSVWSFLDQTMRLYDAPILLRLWIELGPQCPVDVDVVNWVAKAVDCCVRNLDFSLLWKSDPIRMPNILYTCKTLKILALSDKILLDVPSLVSLPSLTQLDLDCVVYKDEDSHVRLLSGCPVLKRLDVIRYADVDVDDNARNFSVKVPSLLSLSYLLSQVNENDTDRSLVIDTPALKFLDISDGLGQSCSIGYMPHLVKASIDVSFNPDDNFLRSLSSIKYLKLSARMTMAPWCNAVNYSRLIECHIYDFDPDWCESLVVLLSNCPKLKVFTVDNNYKIDGDENHVPVLWSQPSSVPKCLSSHLEIFRWKGYEGREDEKELIIYILRNSKCLKTARISPNSTCNLEDIPKMNEELKSMLRVST